MKDRGTKAGVQIRVAQVEKLILDMQSRPTILAVMMSEYDVTERTVDMYIKRARDSIHDRNEVDIEKNRREHWARLNSLYQKAVQKNDINQQRLVLADISKLLGLNMEKSAQNTAQIGLAEILAMLGQMPDKTLENQK
jgi:hypothetical protein